MPGVRWHLSVLLIAFFLCSVARTAHPATSNQIQLPNSSGNWIASANAEWKPFNQDDLDVRAGSALDLSAIFPPSGKAGDHGFVIINDNGELAFDKTPREPIRFLCADIVMQGMPLETIPQEFDNYAEQIARAGYNIVRPISLDDVLTQGITKDNAFNTKALRNWDRFAAALKARGIYLFLDVTTMLKPPRGMPLYYDPEARERWKSWVKAFLTHVNPYTGLALKDDPIVAIGQLTNESGINSLVTHKGEVDPTGLVVPFREWLHSKYQSTGALKMAWGQKQGDPRISVLPAGETIDSVGLPPVNGNGPDSADLQRFFVDLERDSFHWMAAFVRSLGLRIPLTMFNDNCSFQSDLTRDVLPLVDNHMYHDDPQFPAVRLPNDEGMTEKGTNPIASGLVDYGPSYYSPTATTRQLGRPFTASEWGHVLWNPYRYQSGVTVPAYAALQGWQMIAQFDDPIRQAHPAEPFSQIPTRGWWIFNDPPLKAGEYMSALFFRRGDVRASPHIVEIDIDPRSISERFPLWDFPESSLTKLALLTGLGVRVTDWPGAAHRAAYHADLRLSPDASQYADSPASRGQSSVPAEVAKVSRLRAVGILPTDNRTDPSKGLFESDTGQIALDERAETIQIATPMSQGGSLFPGGPGLHLPNLDVRLSGADGSVFAGSLTEQPLATSPHILLLISTDALNTGMTFTDRGRQKLVELGHGPILIRVVQADISLRNTARGQAHLWALAPSGKRVEEIPLTVKNGLLSAHIDTAGLRNGPTPYFEIVRTEN